MTPSRPEGLLVPRSEDPILFHSFAKFSCHSFLNSIFQTCLLLTQVRSGCTLLKIQNSCIWVTHSFYVPAILFRFMFICQPDWLTDWRTNWLIKWLIDLEGPESQHTRSPLSKTYWWTNPKLKQNPDSSCGSNSNRALCAIYNSWLKPKLVIWKQLTVRFCCYLLLFIKTKQRKQTKTKC